MPKIYEYFGLIFLLHTRGELGHPVHVHIKYAETESKVEIKYSDGKLSQVQFKRVKGFSQIPLSKQREAKEFIKKYHHQISEKWFELFIKKHIPKFEKVTRKIK